MKVYKGGDTLYEYNYEDSQKVKNKFDESIIYHTKEKISGRDFHSCWWDDIKRSRMNIHPEHNI